MPATDPQTLMIAALIGQVLMATGILADTLFNRQLRIFVFIAGCALLLFGIMSL